MGSQGGLPIGSQGGFPWDPRVGPLGPLAHWTLEPWGRWGLEAPWALGPLGLEDPWALGIHWPLGTHWPLGLGPLGPAYYTDILLVKDLP